MKVYVPLGKPAVYNEVTMQELLAGSLPVDLGTVIQFAEFIQAFLWPNNYAITVTHDGVIIFSAVAGSVGINCKFDGDTVQVNLHTGTNVKTLTFTTMNDSDRRMIALHLTGIHRIGQVWGSQIIAPLAFEKSVYQI
jgi:hypothetical protein